jgi:hypothetical protein
LFNTNIIASELKYDYLPAVTGNSNLYSQIYYGGINYNKIKLGKLVCDGSPSPTWGEKADILLAKICEQVQYFCTKTEATRADLWPHMESNLHRQIYIFTDPTSGFEL